MERWRWRVRLWRVRQNDRARHRFVRHSIRGVPVSQTVERIVGRVSPFDPKVGYKRRWIRRWGYRLRFPRTAIATAWWTAVIRVTQSATIGPGRYEGNMSTERPKVAWLDESEPTDAAGDVEVDEHRRLFADVDVPWSDEPEHWVLTTDDEGFVYGDRYVTESAAVQAFAGGEVDCA